MLLRVSLILAILASIGVVVVSQVKVREHISAIIAEREKNAQDRDNERKMKQTAQKHLLDTTNRLVQTQTKLTGTEAELATTKTRVTEAEGRITALNTELARVKQERSTAQQQLAQWDIIGLAPEQVRTVINDLKNTKAYVDVLEEEKRLIQNKMKQLEGQLATLIGTNSNYEVPLPLGLKGKVLTVDPKWNFVVLDIGSRQSVLANGVLMVHRNSRLVGKVKILNVMEDRSIANILPGWSLGEIQEGDEVLH